MVGGGWLCFLCILIACCREVTYQSPLRDLLLQGGFLEQSRHQQQRVPAQWRRQGGQQLLTLICVNFGSLWHATAQPPTAAGLVGCGVGLSHVNGRLQPRRPSQQPRRGGWSALQPSPVHFSSCRHAVDETNTAAGFCCCRVGPLTPVPAAQHTQQRAQAVCCCGRRAPWSGR